MRRQVALAIIAATVGPVAIITLMGPRLVAQVVPPTADTPTFEAASVRPAADTGRRGGRGTPGRFTGINLPARQLIRQAYDVHDAQIVGGPDWLDSQGFDINATTGDKPPVQMRFMMQTMLRDRFKLTFHSEKRELPIYALIVARSDGRLGPGLKRITAFNRIVQNETHLEGLYDFDFKWTNEFAARGGPPPAGPSPTQAPGDEPTLVTALQEQLGLKLDARRATVDVLVIDSAEKPTEN